MQLNMKFHLYNLQKALACAEPRRFYGLSVEIHVDILAVGDWKNQKSGKYS